MINPAIDPSLGVVVMDLRLAHEVMNAYLIDAYQSRGILTVDPSELRETSDDAVGGIVTYVLSYAKTMQRPVIAHDTSTLVRLAERLSEVFLNVHDASRALHAVEEVLLELITNGFEHLGNNFEVQDYVVHNNSLYVNIRVLPPLQLQPPSF